MIKIIDGLIDDIDLRGLQELLTGNSRDGFPWAYNSYTIEPGTSPWGRSGQEDLDDFQMTHVFYGQEQNGIGRPFSIYFDCVRPILNKIGTRLNNINILSLIRIKANLRSVAPRKDMVIGYHTDISDKASSKITTAIFYVNTNNGYTLFKDTQKKVESIENRLVIFPANIEHCGVSCTDTKQRIVINFNYITDM